MGKYDNINFKPPEGVREAYKRGLALHEEGKTGDGLEAATVAMARKLAGGDSVSPEWARKGNRFWGRNERFLDEDKDSAAYASAMLWGGRPGKTWFSKLVEQMDAADKDTASNQECAQLVRAVNRSQIIKHAKGWTIRDVVPVIDDIVMNGGLYPADELEASYQSMDGVPAPIGHPKDANGDFISAMRGEGLRNAYAGITVENPRKEGERYLVDLEINEAQAMAHPDGGRLVDALNSGESIHVSTGLLLIRNQETGISRGKRYSWRATNMQFDHVAVLLDEVGAATPEQGVGIMANQAELVVNLDEYEAGLIDLDDESETRIANTVLDKLRALFAPSLQGSYNAEHAQSIPTSSGEAEMNEDQVKSLIADAVSGLATNADMDAKDKKIKELEDKLNAMKEKMSANEDAELSRLANEAAELTGKEVDALKAMGVNALETLIDVAKGSQAAHTANSARGSNEEADEFADYDLNANMEAK